MQNYTLGTQVVCFLHTYYNIDLYHFPLFHCSLCKQSVGPTKLHIRYTVSDSDQMS